MWWWHADGSWSWVVMVAWMVIFWGAVIWAVVAVAGRGRETSEPEQVLARRFAAGDIDEDEYHRRLGVLREQHVAR